MMLFAITPFTFQKRQQLNISAILQKKVCCCTPLQEILFRATLGSAIAFTQPINKQDVYVVICYLTQYG